ncbi:glycosyltransferase family 9 protein [Candidatus Omnitrophota bacterium]
MAKKILIINPFGIGDVLFSTPLISAIKKGFPGCNIAYICNIRTKEILETNPDISEVFVFERDEYRALWKNSKIDCIKKICAFWKEIKKRGFDVVIDLSLGKEFAFLCRLIGIKERRGFDYKSRGRFLTHKIAFDGFNDKPVAEYYLDVVNEKRQEIRDKSFFNTTLVVTDDDKKYIEDFLKQNGVKKDDFLVGLAPGGGISFGKKDQDRRRWPAERFAELSDRIAKEFNAKIVLIWGPGEEELVGRIASLMKESSLMASETTIRQMAALCDRCRVVICSEGGPLHIASSQAVKIISMFGPVDEKVYGSYPPSKNKVVITADIDCRPCYKRFKLPKCDINKCIEDIAVDTVFNSFLKLKE